LRLLCIKDLRDCAVPHGSGNRCNHLANNTKFSERLGLLILIAAFSVPDAAGNTLVLARSINDTTSRNQPSAARALAILKRLKR
jgi:hypothetical protein